MTFKDLLTENLIPVGPMLGAFQVAAKCLGVAYEPRYSVRSAGVALSLVQAGLAVSVMPECLLSHELFGRVAVVELAEPWAMRRIHIATARGRPLGTAARALIKQLLDRPREESGVTEHA